ncbi:uncharacterized protein LOC114432047 isoform X1 [Parambassis ranga]|uniref:Uncharacterized protein LOC114432047 isoform X1 n=2 Tax=Parambassis ranga TaxID=210632 RepID=A0A6P7I5C9_9TELE|nr:uncharacterized protein LOC114432047 isoform X1 [Parambassis ranga]
MTFTSSLWVFFISRLDQRLKQEVCLCSLSELLCSHTIMDLLWMILLLVLIRADAQRVTEVRGEEGGNLTLTCSSLQNETNIHWFMEVYRGFRTCIGRTFTPTHSTFCSPDFESKYLMESNRLVVKDLTAEDSRLYSCGRRNQSGLHFVDSFNLTLGKTSVKTSGDGSSSNSTAQTSTTEHFLYGSLSLNAALMCAVTGLICALCCVKRRSSLQQQDRQPAFPCEIPKTVDTVQYEEIQLPPTRPPRSECIYYKAQLPAAMLSPC